MPQKLTKTIALFLCLCLVFEQVGFAQVASLNIAGYLSALSSQATDKFRPLHLRSLSYDNQNNNFKLLLDKGDFLKGLSPGFAGKSMGTVPESSRQINLSQEDAVKLETKKLMEYFYIGLTLPNDAFWVNLRPDIQKPRAVGAPFMAPAKMANGLDKSTPYNDVIDSDLAQTDIGRIMLETDVQLKKDTARMTSPETPEGKLYWDKLYKKAEELFGTENITIPTLTRPWIVPNEIIIRETKDSAYIYKATLKVMLEEDYLQTDPRGLQSRPLGSVTGDPRLKILNEYSTQLIKELIIPKLTKEVNTSKRYAELRQVYYSLILAQWFKARFAGRPQGPPLPEGPANAHRVGAGLVPAHSRGLQERINSNNLTNLTSKTSWSPEAYFQQYQKSFKEGEYNIKEPGYTAFGQTIRSYFSGGEKFQLSIPAFGATSSPASGGSITSLPASSPVVANGNNIGIEVKASSMPGKAGEVRISGGLVPSPSLAVKPASSPVNTDETVVAKLNSLVNRNDLEYGLLRGQLRDVVTQIYSKLYETFVHEGLSEEDSERLALTLSKMKNGSLEILHLTGVITEEIKDILNARDVNKLGALSKEAKQELSLRLKALADSYSQNLTKGRKREMMKRLVPLEIVELLTKSYRVGRSALLFIISGHGDFPVWLVHANVKVAGIEDRVVGGRKIAWSIIVAHGLENVDEWMGRAETKVKEITARVGSRTFAWTVVSSQGLDKLDGWLEEAEAKAEEIKDQVGGLKNAWFIILAQGLKDVDEWSKKASKKVEEIKDKVGGSANAWLLVIGQGLNKIDAWMQEAEPKAKSISGLAGGISNAWTIVIGHRLTQVNSWVREASIKADEIKGRWIPYAWAIIINQGLEKNKDGTYKADIWVKKAEIKVKEIQGKVGGKSNAWEIIIAQGMDKIDDWIKAAELKVKEIEDKVGGLSNAWRIIMDQGLNKNQKGAYEVDEWIKSRSPGVEDKVKSGMTLSGAWQQVIRYKSAYESSSADTQEENPANGLTPLSTGAEQSRSASSPAVGSQITVDSSQKNKAASPPLSSQRQDLGGIDFTSLPIVTQAMVNLSADMIDFSKAGDGRGRHLRSLVNTNLDEEWQGIEKLVNAGIEPSAERIKGYIQASCLNGNVDKDMRKVVACIGDILRQEEETCADTDPVMRDILVVLESISSLNELKEVFAGGAG